MRLLAVVGYQLLLILSINLTSTLYAGNVDCGGNFNAGAGTTLDRKWRPESGRGY